MRFVRIMFLFFFSSRRRHTRYIGDWSSDVCSSDLGPHEFNGSSTAFVTGGVMPEMSRMVEIWIFAGLGVMVLLFLMSGMARLYRKAGPHEALIVYGLGGTRVGQGHGTLVL